MPMSFLMGKVRVIILLILSHQQAISMAMESTILLSVLMRMTIILPVVPEVLLFSLVVSPEPNVLMPMPMSS